MKTKLFCLLGTLLLVLGSCKLNYPVAQQSGKEDMGYLLFVSPKQYAKKDVKVTLDGQNAFTANVVREKDAKRKGTAYRVTPGRKTIKVEHEGKVLYTKEIFISAQETKQIELP